MATRSHFTGPGSGRPLRSDVGRRRDRVEVGPGVRAVVSRGRPVGGRDRVGEATDRRHGEEQEEVEVPVEEPAEPELAEPAPAVEPEGEQAAEPAGEETETGIDQALEETGEALEALEGQEEPAGN